MKHLILTVFIIGSVSFGFSQDTEGNKNLSEITFENTIYDYGTIPLKGDGTCEFKFRNTGKSPLILNNVKTSCGCTVPEWPKEPINPKQEGVIKVKYNTTRAGNFQKSITVYSNAKNPTVQLTIKGKVDSGKPDASPEKDKTIISTE
ncbi:MAG: DUF1573 domain-containing protein [Bacteroidota bacterium]